LVPEGTSTTVLWSPVTDSDAPWIWWDTLHLMYEEYVVDVIQSVLTSSARRVIDSKAMRIVRNQELQYVVETVNLVSSAPTSIISQVRILSGK